MLGNVINIVGQGFYCITGYTNAGSVTVDRALGTFSTTSGKVGGAYSSFNAVGTDPLLPIVAGNTIYVLSGTYTSGGAANYSGVNGTGSAIIQVIGYTGSRAPATGSSRPVFANGIYEVSTGSFWFVSNFQVTGGNATASFRLSDHGLFNNCKMTCSGSGNVGLRLTSSCRCINCECSGIGNYPILALGTCIVEDCYIHDAQFGPDVGVSIVHNIIESCVAGIALGDGVMIEGNIIVNCVTGIQAENDTGSALRNNSITHCYCALTPGSNYPGYFSDYNNYYANNTANPTMTLGGHDIALNPNYVSPILTGTDGATNGSPGTTFTSASSNFSGVSTLDTIVIKAGSGATTGVYAISAVAPGGDNTKLTLATSPGNSRTGMTWGIVTGGAASNFASSSQTGNLYNAGSVGAFPGTGTTGHLSIGAWQPDQPTQPAAADVQAGAAQYGYAGSLLTPSYQTTATTQAADSGIVNTNKASILTSCTIVFGSNSVTGTYNAGSDYTAGQAAQLLTDQASVTSVKSHLDSGYSACGITGTLDISTYTLKSGVVDASYVLTGHNNYSGGSAGSLTLPNASDLWYQVQCGVGGTSVTGTKRASSISNCSPPNVKAGVQVDDVLGSYTGAQH